MIFKKKKSIDDLKKELAEESEKLKHEEEIDEFKTRLKKVKQGRFRKTNKYKFGVAVVNAMEKAGKKADQWSKNYVEQEEKEREKRTKIKVRKTNNSGPLDLDMDVDLYDLNWF